MTRVSPVDEDVAVIDMGWIHVPGTDSATIAAVGAISDAYAGIAAASSGDLDDLDTAYSDFLTTIVSLQGHGVTWSLLKVIREDTGHPTPNTPVREHTLSIAGDSSALMPPQVAMTITQETALRRRWGRFYVPSLRTANFDSYGRAGDALVDGLEGAYVTLVGAMAGADFYPVVLVKNPPGVTLGTAHTVIGTRVDNVADVIRRRRWDGATYRKRDPIP